LLEQLHQCNVQQILDEEKSKHASLAQQNGFGPAFLHRMLRLAKGTAEPSTYCSLARWFNWSMWVAIINLQPFAVTVLVL
jgi:hypothetical protein